MKDSQIRPDYALRLKNEYGNFLFSNNSNNEGNVYTSQKKLLINIQYLCVCFRKREFMCASVRERDTERVCVCKRELKRDR